MTLEAVGYDQKEMPHTALPNPTGVLSGSCILTLDGEMAVEHLSPGDRIVTRDRGRSVLKSVHHRLIYGRAVRILAGSLGNTRRDRDVLLPAGQLVVVRDWRAQALFGQAQTAAPAHELVDGEFIKLEGNLKLSLYELRFDSQHVFYADGLELIAPAEHVFRSNPA